MIILTFFSSFLFLKVLTPYASIGVRDQFRSGGGGGGDWGLLPEDLLYRLLKIKWFSRILLAFLPENGHLKNYKGGGGAAAPLAPAPRNAPMYASIR